MNYLLRILGKYLGRRVPAIIVAVGMLVNVNLLVNQNKEGGNKVSIGFRLLQRAILVICWTKCKCVFM